MEKKEDIFVSFVSFFAFAGIILLAFSAHYIQEYFNASTSPYRHEYLEGATLIAIPALICWVLVSILAAFISKKMPKAIYFLLNVPAVFLGDVAVDAIRQSRDDE